MPSTELTPSAPQAQNLASRIAGQSAMLFAGFGAAQMCSFARNAIIGHWLSKGDFGIAATITLLLQLIETTSDLGADRLILQADDGDDKALIGTVHLALIGRGVIIAAVMYLSAGLMSAFFAIPQAQWAFEMAAVVPLIKGFMHLDPRRFQRRLQNRAQITVETLPQIIALAATVPMLHIFPDYRAIVWLALAQAIAAVGLSHRLAERAYNTDWDGEKLIRLFTFGWPIWASAFPLIAVYQGDRIVIGHMLGMEALAGYTAAFMVAMVPGLIAAKIGNALLLPLFGQRKHNSTEFRKLFMHATDATVIVAACYLSVFLFAGERVLPLAFGDKYTGLGTVTAWLALMWAMRMVQAVPGLALMALGETRPLLVAGTIRAAGLLIVIWVAFGGFGLTGIAAAGCGAELASLIYIAVRAGRDRVGITSGFLQRCVTLAAAAGFALVLSRMFVSESNAALLLETLTGTAIISIALLLVLPLGQHFWFTLRTIRESATS